MNFFCCKKKIKEEKERATLASSARSSAMTDIKDLFDLFDQDKNGVVTKDEILRTFNSLRLPITDDHAQKLIQEFDRNGDDELEFVEFVSLIKKYLSEADYPTQGMFKYFDRDGDGYITLDEFIKSMRCVGVHISEAEAAAVVPKYYTPGTNKMDYRHFNKLMKSLMI